MLFFYALGSARLLTAITCQCVAYLSEAAPQMVALGLLSVLILLTFLFWKMRYGRFSRSGSHIENYVRSVYQIIPHLA